MNSEKQLKSLLWTIFFNQTCLTMTFPLLTLLFFDTQSRLFTPDTSHAVRSMWYGLCIAIPSTMNIFFTPLLSTLSDIYGRKKMLLIEIFSAALFTLTAALGVIYGIFICLFCGLIIQGALTRTNPTAIAIVSDLSNQGNKLRNMGYLQFAISVGAFSGPLLGGYFANRFFFAHINFAFPYFVAAGFAIISGGLALFFLRETLNTQPSFLETIHTNNPRCVQVKHSRARSHLSLSSFKQLLADPSIIQISVILLFTQISWSMYYQYIPPVLKTLHQFSAHDLGLFVGLIAFWLAVTTGLGIKIIERYFATRALLLFSLYLLLFGLILSALSCLPFAELKPLIWLGAFPTAAGDVIAYTCLTTLYSNTVDGKSQGKIMGFSFIIIASVWALTGIIGGTLLSYAPILPLMIAPFGVISALVLMHRRPVVSGARVR